MKNFYARYKHAIPLILYTIIYMAWFAHLEQTISLGKCHVIHMAADDYIPFCEYFIIPYLLWFLYIPVVIAYFFFTDKTSYYALCIFLATGMTLFLIISTIYPNGQFLRPAIMPRNNIFTRLITYLYHADTATSLFPSIHAYNSLGAHLALMKSPKMAKHKRVQFASLILCVSITCATLLIKQHSLFDVLTAFALAFIMYIIVYQTDFLFSLQRLMRDRNEKNKEKHTLAN